METVDPDRETFIEEMTEELDLGTLHHQIDGIDIMRETLGYAVEEAYQALRIGLMAGTGAFSDWGEPSREFWHLHDPEWIKEQCWTAVEVSLVAYVVPLYDDDQQQKIGDFENVKQQAISYWPSGESPLEDSAHRYKSCSSTAVVAASHALVRRLRKWGVQL